MDYGKRPDGTPKGLGFFGEIKRRDGNGFSTELSAESDVDGKRLLYPLLVPTLKRHEIDHLVNDGEASEEMHNKAIDHALGRIKAGKSPFAGRNEQMPLPAVEGPVDAIKRGLGYEMSDE